MESIIKTIYKVVLNLGREIPIFEKYYDCLFAGGYHKECDTNIERTKNPDMCLQKIRETALSAIYEKRYYLNEIESIPWGWIQSFITI